MPTGTRPSFINIAAHDRQLAARLLFQSGWEPSVEAALAFNDRELEDAARRRLAPLAAATILANTGKAQTLDEGLEAVAEERGETHLRVARAIAELGPVEAALAARIHDAQATLDAANGELAKARAMVVGLVSSREQLRQAITQKKAQARVLDGKLAMVEGRRAKAFDLMRRKLLTPGEGIGYAPMLDAAVVVAGLDLALAELGKFRSAIVAEVQQAEEASADFENEHARELEEIPVSASPRGNSRGA